jgi:alanine-synthesizing transaminase
VFSRRLIWDLEENRLATLEGRLRAAGRTLIDLTTTNPTQVALDYPVSALATALAEPAIARYEPSPLGPRVAREAVAGEYARLGAAVDPEQIILTASSSESYAYLFKLLCDPGDVILFPRPSYPLFDYLARLEGLEPRPYGLVFDGLWRIDWDSFDAQGARVLIAVSPNNPTGSFLRRDDFTRLEEMAAARGLALIVDEVFADFPLGPAPDAVGTVAAGPPAGVLTFCLGGLSKSCGLPQMKLGWIAAVGPPALVAAARARLELVADTYLSVGGPVLRGLPRLLAVGAEVRRQILARVARNRAALAAALAPHVPCTLLPAEAGWSAILRVPAVLDDEAWALLLLEEEGVLVQPGYFFDLAGLGVTLVLSLLPEPGTFDSGLRRILDRAGRL